MAQAESVGEQKPVSVPSAVVRFRERRALGRQEVGTRQVGRRLAPGLLPEAQARVSLKRHLPMP